MAIGRITGPLLKSNLIRDGVDLAFETDLLYLDVNNSRIGVNTSSPQYDLDVAGLAKTTNLEVTDQLTIGNFTVSGNTITSDQPTINFVASGGEATAYHSRLIVNDIELDGNTISTISSNANLELRPNGTGIVDIQAPTEITGNLAVSGNINAEGDITIGGNLIIGDNITDSITINASIKSHLIPETNITYDLGSSSFHWRNVYANGIFADNLSLSSFTVGNISLHDNVITTTSGQDLILDPNGSGAIRLGNFSIRNNVITNTVSGSVTELTQTGTGYFKISGTNGFVPPRGSTAARPWSLPEDPLAIEGMTRYNTDSKALEIWDGNVWASPAGTIGAVSESTAIEIAIQYALTLG
jgi:hypothetical protein